MSRRVVTRQLEVNIPRNPPIDGYFDRVIKYIPADIVAAWTAVTGLIKGASGQVPENSLLWVVFAVGLVLTALWTLKQTAQEGKPPAKTQTLISTAAFAVWVFALGSPFDSLGFYHPVYGSLSLIGFTLAVGLIAPPED